MAALTTTVPQSSRATEIATREQACRVALRVIAAFVAIGLIGHLAVLLWARHEFTPVESLVALHSSMLVHGEGLYYNLNRYPFTVSPYGPIFYAASGCLQRLGAGPYFSGRILSFAALLTSLWLCWKALGYLTTDRYARATGALLAASTSNILFWGTVGQVDMLAACCSLAALTLFLRYREQREIKSLVWSAILVILAIFTKQTSMAAGAAIGLTLLVEERRRGVYWIASVGVAAACIALALNAVTHGGYFSDAIVANINPFAWHKLGEQSQYLILTGAGVILTAVIGAWHVSRRSAPLFVYAGFSVAIWLVTAPKIGSDLNYQIEMMLALSMCAADALAELEFFPSLFAGRRTWVTLLQVPLLLHVAVNALLTARVVAERALLEPARSEETAALKPYVAGPGRVLSAHYDSLVQYRGDIEVEPLIYSLLVQAGRADPRPLLRDLSTRQFANILLLENVFDPSARQDDAEFAHLPAAQIDAIRRNYRVVEQVKGPYGVYVYEPRHD
jgi:hypothetical protein